MSADIQTIAGVRNASAERPGEDESLHPARGVVLAVMLSAMFWAAVVVATLLIT